MFLNWRNPVNPKAKKNVIQIPDKPSISVCENGNILKLKLDKTGRGGIH